MTGTVAGGGARGGGVGVVRFRVGIALVSRRPGVADRCSRVGWGGCGAGHALDAVDTDRGISTGASRSRCRCVGRGLLDPGAVLGILGAGVLLEQWSWTSVFVGLTVAGAVLAGLACSIAESRQQEHPPVDWVGAVTVVVAVGGAIVFAVIEVPARGWSDSLVAISTAVGLFAVVVFVVVELRSSAPLLDVRLFARRGFGAGALSVCIQFLVTFGGVFLLLVQYLQLILGYGPLTAALALTPYGRAAHRDLGDCTLAVEHCWAAGDDHCRSAHHRGGTGDGEQTDRRGDLP